MSVEFLEDAPDKIYTKRQNTYFEWKDGRRLVMPIDQSRIANARLDKALAEHDAKLAKVVQIGTRHAATS